MRWLAVLSLVLLTGCASAPPQLPRDRAVAVHPPLPIEHPWLAQRPADEVTLFDTRMLQALRKRDETAGLNAVQRPVMWLGIGFGVAYGLFLLDASDEILDCLFSCDDDD
jgi:hypothetical protein